MSHVSSATDIKEKQKGLMYILKIGTILRNFVLNHLKKPRQTQITYRASGCTSSMVSNVVNDVRKIQKEKSYPASRNG